MNTCWSDGLSGLEPYVPGEQPLISGLIKLNTNECPYPPSPAALEAIRAAANEDMRLYPDPCATALKQAVAELHGVAPENVFAGNGSDEVLAHAWQAFLRHSRPALFPDITYSFYPVYCNLFGISCKRIPLDERFRVRIEDYLQPNGGIVLANPNAPTGIAMPAAEIRRLLEANTGSVVIIDEAYVDFGAESVIPLIREYPNLLVIHTLSKSRALAGLRVGFAIGDSSLIEALERIKGSFNSYPLNRLAIAGAVAAIKDRAYFDKIRTMVMASRKKLAGELAALGFEVLPSSSNFLFARQPDCDATLLYNELRSRRILVRHFLKPRIDQFLRITIGSDEQCEALTVALREILGNR
jgi:histidinol-phosphate aminotransferase